jgi:multidrug efflux pump subunit AcrB
MRKIISFFIRYHVAVNVLIGAFFVFGLLGFKALKSSFFPLVESKFITINITYPGASPQEIEEGIVLQIEDNLKGLRGVDRVTSVSSENSGSITVEIEKGENIDFMLLEVKMLLTVCRVTPQGWNRLSSQSAKKCGKRSVLQ